MSSNFSFNSDFVSNFVNNFDYEPRVKWFQTNWTQSFYFSFVYILIVFVGKNLMHKRKAFKLRTTLVIWNLILATFSIFGSMRKIPELIQTVKNSGFEYSVCYTSYHNPCCSFWTYMFVISKVPELIDTLFIILRKQRLIFLHWYHHVTVLLFTWMSYADHSSAGRWYVSMNYIVHAMMYSYYCLRATGIRLPKFIRVVITSSQIIQMVIGITVTIYALVVKSAGNECTLSYHVIYAGILMYSSYFVLFANFFINTYFVKQKTQ